MRRILVVLIALSLLGGYLLSGVRIVRPGERAVVRRFGRVLDQKPAPGMWIGLPWGMDRFDRVPVSSVQHVPVGYDPEAEERGATTPGQVLTGDHNLVNIRVVLYYAVDPDENAVVDYVLQGKDRTESLLARAAETVLVEWVAARKVDDVLIKGKAELPTVLVEQTQARIHPYHLGIKIQSASVDALQPPEEVKAAFDEVTKAKANIETQTRDAQREAKKKWADAETEKYRIREEARSYAYEQHRRAQAEAKSFLLRLARRQLARQKNPDIDVREWLDDLTELFDLLAKNGQLRMLPGPTEEGPTPHK
jgi:membrane protease subunit HflK